MGKKQNQWFPLLCIGYILAGLALFLFSYTQVDLSLTLSQSSIFQFIEKTFQYVGFFERPVATVWYISVIIVYFLLYGLTLFALARRKITRREVWILICSTIGLLILSYPAFSYDIFNYMFTAKTVLVYHQNPYFVIPLQFTGVEPWLSFMHWTHLPSAYTPLWILITLPFYLFGFGYFLLTLWSFKLIAAIFYFLTVWYINKILETLEPNDTALGVAIFALNPLVIIEILVSAHNDIVMMALVMMSIYYFLTKKKTLSYFLLALSVGAKLMTIFLYPVILFGYKRLWALIAMCVGFALVLTQREVLAWYWVWIVPFVALLPDKKAFTIISAGASLGLLLRYAPYFYWGNWNAPVPTIELWGTLIPVVISFIFVGGSFI